MNRQAEGKAVLLGLCGAGERLAVRRKRKLSVDEQELILNTRVLRVNIVISPMPLCCLALDFLIQGCFLSQNSLG